MKPSNFFGLFKASVQAEENVNAPRKGEKENRADERESFRLDGLAALEAIGEQPLLVENTITQGSVVMIFGQSGAGKSFTAIDLVLRIASGLSWLGRDVARGGVVYFPSEGRANLANRFNAWFAENGVAKEDAPVAFILQDIDLRDRHRVGELIDHLKEKKDRFKHGLKAIFFDVFVGYLGGGDENSNPEMNLVMGNLHWLAQELGVTVFIIHHSGWGNSDRERGASALRAACDAVFCVSKDGRDGIRLKTAKQKDFEDAEEWALDKVKVELPNGKTSLVLRRNDSPQARTSVSDQDRFESWALEQLSANDNAAELASMRAAFREIYAAEKGLDPKEDATKISSAGGKAFVRALNSLSEKGAVRVQGTMILGQKDGA